ncbi:50S ribosomal protein L10 [Anaplasma capra]|uniref:50S ribosomal protein L10 n=1 Tax=Anaplasma capra TaxID=1562740 RepID=UPI0021D60143|nr:50S ribosomal protein L10 [Anaplasma capra]MCU7611331.1 50S ribosomal protein L10 [Anaplasma capra]MCU7612405.1 50S ribosomal protein L10 [Anaplasma capra]
MKRVNKERHLGKIEDVFTKFGSFVLANFRSMTAGDFVMLRKELKAQGCGVTVMKNSIARVALKQVGKAGELEDKFREAVFVAYSEDIVTVSKIVHKFMKSASDKVTLVCAYDGGQVLPADRIVFFSNLPSLRELHMRIMGLIAYGVPVRLANCLRAIGKGEASV